MEFPTHKPILDAQIIKLLDFNGAIAAILDGKRVTRKEWDNKGWYCLLKDDILSIHKAGESEETIRPWIINNGDLGGSDWIIL